VSSVWNAGVEMVAGAVTVLGASGAQVTEEGTQFTVPAETYDWAQEFRERWSIPEPGPEASAATRFASTFTGRAAQVGQFYVGGFRAGALLAEGEATVRAAGIVAEEGGTVARVGELKTAIPPAQEGRITMGVGLAEDANGGRLVLVGTSEPRGYLRPGVTLAPGERLAPGLGHAEADIVNYSRQNGLKLLEVGATRGICPECAAAIESAGAKAVTPMKVR
jgi:hypothetical protein